MNSASTVTAPYLSKGDARQMPEFEEGRKARVEGKSMADCPYSISKQSELQQKLIESTEWRVQLENRFHAWMHGFNENIAL